MIRHIIHRPIAVSMIVIALAVLGIVATRFIPVSLMPEIDIPRITVQVSSPGSSVTEVEQQMVNPLRHQLAQVAGLKEIETESRMDAGTLTLRFEPGENMDLLFIDVNEKIDRAMNSMPKEMERPKVIKASAMDIPAFYLDIKLKDEHHTPLQFAELGHFVRNVIAKRLEQLPQTAMVDVSGTVGTEIQCIPDLTKMEALGLTTRHIEQAIRNNNIMLEALSIVNGINRYSIHFDSQILNKEDIGAIYLQQGGRLIQLKDICTIKEVPTVRNGYVRNGGEDAVTLAVIKQNDAQMADLQESIAVLLDNLRSEYPYIDFIVTRDQTELLTYSMDNLKGNLYVGALLACAVLFFFMRNWRMPLLVIITIPLSLILTLLTFYLLGITINIISLSGLILGVGMIVDNSIIVIDSIVQKRNEGFPLCEAIPQGVNEVFTPMLSSVLTTCSVFIPLIFLSGTAGALFYDQAMGVTIALFASLLVATLVIPVYFYVLFRNRAEVHEVVSGRGFADKWIYLYYERGMRWVLRHAKICSLGFVATFVLVIVVYPHLKKERLPYMEHADALVTIDWNQGISVAENDRRVQNLLAHAGRFIETSTSMAGTQEFLLSHTQDITTNEAVCYMKATSVAALDSAERCIADYLTSHYPESKVEFAISGNVYDLIFSSDKADLEIRLQRERGGRPSVEEASEIVDILQRQFPAAGIQPVAVEENLRYVADVEQLAIYGVTYQQLYDRLRELVNSRSVHEINSGSQSIPVIVGIGERDASKLLSHSVTNKDGVEVPLRYLVDEQRTENFKRQFAGSEGEYYPIRIKGGDRMVEDMVDKVRTMMDENDCTLRATFVGDYYESRQMIGELAVCLLVAVALLYFILAAQFESLVQPLIILTELVVDIGGVMVVLYLCGESLNLMSMIGLVTMSGIIINDSILKVDTINRLYRSGHSLLRAVLQAGHSRLKPILMTSLTTILAILPFLHRGDMGSAMQYPLSLALIVGMTIGTLVSVFLIPLAYYLVYRTKK